jgi:FkbM family methyltransferase
MKKARIRSAAKRAYHRLVMLATAGKGVARRTPDGKIIRLLPGYWHLNWQPAECAAFKSRLRSGHVVLDIGANAGAYALWFGLVVGERGKVFAFEPAPDTFAGLKAHIALNGMDDRITAVPAAVRDRPGEAEFIADGFQGTNRLMIQGERAAGMPVVRVPCVSVDEYCAGAGVRPDLIKVDVEGFELEALRGARETLSKPGVKPSVFVELHPTRWPDLGYGAAEVRAFLLEMRLEAVPLSPTMDPWSQDSGMVVELRPLP